MVLDGLKPKGPAKRIRFTEFAASLFEHKLKTGRVKSAKSQQKWESVIRLHLPAVFGDLFVGCDRRTDLKAWKETTVLLVRRSQTVGGEVMETTGSRGSQRLTAGLSRSRQAE